MPYSLFHIIHLISVFLLTGVVFAAFAAPVPELRRHYLVISGITSLIALLTGFGLLGILKLGVPLWAVAKVFCWLLLSVLGAMAFRIPERRPLWLGIAVAALVIAISMVSLKPGL